MTIDRRDFLAATAAGSLALTSSFARAQGLPDTAKILAGFAPGGTVDVTARRIADKLRDVVAKSVVVENRSGAGGQLALSALKAAPNDGLTFLVTPMSSPPDSPHTYAGTPSMMLNGAWVGMMRSSRNPAAARSTRYSASVRSSAP